MSLKYVNAKDQLETFDKYDIDQSIFSYKEPVARNSLFNSRLTAYGKKIAIKHG